MIAADDERLANYLDASMRPFCDGQHDCCLFLADWVQIIRGVDAAAKWRGRYSSARGWARFVREAGGLEAIIREGAESIGLVPTMAPRRGDVGVVLAPTVAGMAPVGAIWTGRAWAYLMTQGLVIGRAQMLAAWEV